MTEQHNLPWGTVSPDFWQQPASTAPGSALDQLLSQARQAPRPPQRPTTPPAPMDEPTTRLAKSPRPTPKAGPTAPPIPEKAPVDMADRTEVPPEFQAQVAAIYQAVEAGELPQAAAMASDLDDRITAAYGPAHPNTINIRQLRGYIASRMGGNAAACRWFLHTTKLWIGTAGAADPLTQESARWAAASWQSIQNPKVLQEYAPELLDLMATVEGPKSRAVQAIRNHLAAAGQKKPSRPASEPADKAISSRIDPR